MFKSVFTRYVSTFVLIVLISFTLLAAIITAMIKTYSINKREDEVTWIADAIRDVAETGFAAGEGFDGDGVHRDFSLIASKSEDVCVVVFDTDGKVVYQSAPENEDRAFERFMSRFEREPFIIPAEGSERVRGFVTVCLPIVAAGETRGVVAAGNLSAAEDTLIKSLMQTIIVSSLWVMVATLIAVYFISDRSIAPLKEMSVAARSFAKGKFDVRIESTGKDEIAELAGAFNQMAESLSRLEEMRHSFVANVSHDLRTPMTTIAGFIEGILDGTIPPDKHAYYLDIVYTEVKRLSRLVTELLDLSKMQAGEREFKFEPFDVCEMARLVIISFEQKFEEKHLEVDFRSDFDSMNAVGDKDAIYQIVYNLIDNAVKFSREGGTLRVTVKESDHRTVLSVYNEGVGIAEADLPYVFERFYKSDKSRGLDKTGSGLGLYIARTIVEAHGQEIWVDSKEGEWCEFSFTLKSAGRANR